LNDVSNEYQVEYHGHVDSAFLLVGVYATILTHDDLNP